VTPVAFALSAGLGALLRWRLGRTYLGLAAVNVCGSFALGLLADAGPAVATVVGTGGLGAFTTWSSLAVRGVELGEHRPVAGAWFLGGTIVAGILAARLAIAL
jgi:fluoride ion exporter CrcB/FEX